MEEKNTYLRQLHEQIQWHDKNSIKYKKRFIAVKLLNISCAIMISVSSVVSLIFSFKAMPIITAVFGGMITFLESYLNIRQYERFYILYRNTCERLKKEERCYHAKVGPYSRASDRQNLKHLTLTCEDILSETTQEWAENYKKNLK